MTRTIAGRPRTASPAAWPSRPRRAGLLATLAARSLAALFLTGCAGGLIGPLPQVTKPAKAANVTVYRDGSWVGFVGPIILRIDDRLTFRLWRDQQFSFQLDPGMYVFYYTIGFNECRRVAFIEPRGSYRFRMAPNCARFEDVY